MIPSLFHRAPRDDSGFFTRQRLILLSVALSSLLGAIDLSIVNIANPTIIKSLNTSIGMGSLVILSYTLTITGLILIMGKLGDRIGFRRVLLMGLVIFGLGSFFCGISQNIETLIASRMLQAVGAAMFSAIGPAIITEFLPEESRGRSLGWLISLYALGFAIGPGIGGFFTGFMVWNWIFFINIPIVIIAFIVAWYYIPQQEPPAEKKPFRLAGPATLIPALLCLLLSISLFQVPGIPDFVLAMLFAAGIGLGLVYWLIERKNPDPLIDPVLLRNPSFRSGILACLIITMLFSGVTYLMPLYLVNSHHLDQFTAGLIMTIPALFSIIAAPVAGSLADRHGSVLVSLVSVTLMAAGFLIFVTFNAMTVIIVIVAGLLVTRVSTTSFFGPNGRLIMNHCPKGTTGTGSGVMMLVRNMGIVLGVGFFQTVFAIRMYLAGIPRNGLPLVPRITPELSRIGYQAVYIVAFCLCIFVILLLRKTKEKPDTP
jgi:EmrB/QacA subfamily drug resistance transporter